MASGSEVSTRAIITFSALSEGSPGEDVTSPEHPPQAEAAESCDFMSAFMGNCIRQDRGLGVLVVDALKNHLCSRAREPHNIFIVVDHSYASCGVASSTREQDGLSAASELHL